MSLASTFTGWFLGWVNSLQVAPRPLLDMSSKKLVLDDPEA